jgi:DNA replication licensing factor MCM7
MKINVRGVNCKKCAPGDIVSIEGVYMPTPFTGFQVMRAGLTHDTYLEAFKISKDK